MSNAIRPTGWRILVKPIDIKRETDGGILLPEESVKAQEFLRYVGTVVAMGDLAFTGDRFKAHPQAAAKRWCDVGSVVAFGKYAGQEVIVNEDGEQVRMKLVNDDEILAVVEDPAAIVTPL